MRQIVPRWQATSQARPSRVDNSPMTLSYPPPHWHLFCRVIDNFGDIGVAWRLARQLASAGFSVSLWCDDPSALRWMAPEGHPLIRLRPWPQHIDDHEWPTGKQVVLELFGCELPDCVETRIAKSAAETTWINLEYLSAEDYVARSHRLPSPIMSGSARGLRKWFFYPGFTPETGGLLRETELITEQGQFDRQAWRQSQRVTPSGVNDAPLWVSLFCYEPPGLRAMLDALESIPHRLLVTPGRATDAMSAELQTPHWPAHIQALAPVSQADFDHMLWACDLNFVRGEDSLVRAIWAGQAFVWHIYPQEDQAHHDKLTAFLDWLQAPDDLREAHAIWNGLSQAPWPALTAERLRRWQAVVQSARQKLLNQSDLCSQLVTFAQREG